METEKRVDKVRMTKELILDYIQSMDLNQSTKLPREELLAKTFDVSRTTIRSAIKEYIAEGIIFSKQGKGTFVNKEAFLLKTAFSPIADLRVVIANNGYDVKVSVVNLQMREGTEEELTKLNLKKKEKLFIIERLFYADGHPTVYCMDRIALSLFDGNVQYSEKGQSIFTYVEEILGKKIIWDKVELSTLISSEKPFLKEYFNQGKPMALLNCDIINYDEEDRPVIYSNEYIDTNKIRFELIRQKNL